MTLATLWGHRVEPTTRALLGNLVADDGYPLTYRAWRPPGRSRGTIVLFNGIMSHAGWFSPLTAPLLDAGFSVIGADRRGSGLNVLARGDAPSANAIVDDALRIIDHAVEPDQPLLVAGWCWGSILALNLLRPLGERPCGLALLTPGLFPTQQVIEAAKIAARATGGAPDDAPVVQVPVADTMFTRGPKLEEFVRPDPHRLETITPRFLSHSKKLAMGAQLALRKLSLPTLVVLASDDEATDNAATDAAFAQHMITRRVLQGSHGLQFDAPNALSRTLSAFFEQQLLFLH